MQQRDIYRKPKGSRLKPGEVGRLLALVVTDEFQRIGIIAARTGMCHNTIRRAALCGPYDVISKGRGGCPTRGAERQLQIRRKPEETAASKLNLLWKPRQ